MTAIALPDASDSLAIALEQVCYILIKAREFDAKDVATMPDSASNPSDDAQISVLEDLVDDPVMEELTAFIEALDEDEQIDLVALAWLGRSEAGAEAWDTLREEAAAAHNARTAGYLLGLPLLPSYLEAGLACFDASCTDVELRHL